MSGNTPEGSKLTKQQELFCTARHRVAQRAIRVREPIKWVFPLENHLKNPPKSHFLSHSSQNRCMNFTHG
uniref:Uncharacterized protein n=1 Tax=Medicago truncatula TaxID=3880 RepID=A2Q258_MEDTR|nr:hypothetical protein MtrDRAFT_AC149208g46v2 [Medicago truncatula]